MFNSPFKSPKQNHHDHIRNPMKSHEIPWNPQEIAGSPGILPASPGSRKFPQVTAGRASPRPCSTTLPRRPRRRCAAPWRLRRCRRGRSPGGGWSKRRCRWQLPGPWGENDPRCSMYGIYLPTWLGHQMMVNVGKYIPAPWSIWGWDL